MLCEKCHQNPANVHMQQTINGEETSFHLCSQCAQELEMPISFDSFFQGLLDSVLHLQASSQSKNITPQMQAKTPVCKQCGLSYKDFSSTRRLGCSECYNTFRNELEPIFKNIQASCTHQGKFPKKAGGDILNRRTLENLRVSLSKAVQNEEYELAATIRDEIRAMENQIREQQAQFQKQNELKGENSHA